MRLTTAHHDHVVDPNAIMHPGTVTKMLDENLARIRAHRNNISRYRSLLETHLSALERQFIERRITEERSALEAWTSEVFPIALTLPFKGGSQHELRDR